jgi:hypothetical protein
MKDGYPFTLAAPVVDKLRFVHRVIAAASDKAAVLTAGARPAGQTAATDTRQTTNAGATAGNAVPDQTTSQPR